MENNRHKIIWNEDTLDDYADLVNPVLDELRATWLDDHTPSSISMLLSQTHEVLTQAPKSLNKSIDMAKKTKSRRTHIRLHHLL